MPRAVRWRAKDDQKGTGGGLSVEQSSASTNIVKKTDISRPAQSDNPALVFFPPTRGLARVDGRAEPPEHPPNDPLEVVDIALNLADVKYDGRYDNRSLHAPDHAQVLYRAFYFGRYFENLPCSVGRCMVSGGGLEWIRKAYWLMEKHDPGGKLLKTCIGVHPTMVKEFLFLPEKFFPETGTVEVHPPELREWRPPGAAAAASSRGTIISKGGNNSMNYNKPVEVSNYGFADSRIHEHFQDPCYAERHLQLLKTEFLSHPERRRRVVAIGEIGLDYERTKFCPIDLQRRFLELQLPLAAEYDLPLYIHVRGEGCAAEFVQILERVLLAPFFASFRRDMPQRQLEEECLATGRGAEVEKGAVGEKGASSSSGGTSSSGASKAKTKTSASRKCPVFRSGVVHSFTGSVEDLRMLLSYNLYVSVNGCSVRTKAGCDMVKEIPLERLLLETDAPYCRIEKSHPLHPMLTTENITVFNADTVLRTDARLAKGGLAWGVVVDGVVENPDGVLVESKRPLTQADVTTTLFPKALEGSGAVESAAENRGGGTVSTSDSLLAEVMGQLPAHHPAAGKGNKKGKGKKGKKQLTPKEKVEKRNEPINVLQVAEAVALLKGISAVELIRVTRENTRKLLGM
mmetsp:Transcript_26064/g.65714  ORF Transcript_26064/g.65714 Transcript_26064/m.65714 type:complete len:629 (+) Transcript_26064:250-2136(+)